MGIESSVFEEIETINVEEDVELDDLMVLLDTATVSPFTTPMQSVEEVLPELVVDVFGGHNVHFEAPSRLL